MSRERSLAKLGQSWTFDFALGLFLFVVSAVLAITILSNMVFDSSFDDVKEDAMAISQALMTEGIPSNWTEANVIELGLLSDGKLDLTKWLALSAMNYSRSKRVLGAESDYLALLTRINSTGMSASLLNTSAVLPCSIGKNLSVGDSCRVIPVFVDSSNVVRVSRLVSFNGTVLSLTIYVWG